MRILLLATVLVVGEMSDRTYEQPEDAQPVTVTPSALLDAWGDPRFLDVDDPSQASVWGYQAQTIGPAMSTLWTHGLVNADFMQGPPRPSDPIGDDNPLPGWRFVRAQGSIDAYWVDDASSRSGKAIQWRVPDLAATDDESYIEQISAIPDPSLRVMVALADWGPASATNSDIRSTAWLAGLLYDGTEQDTDGVLNFATWGGEDVVVHLRGRSALTHYQRTRIRALVTFGPVSGAYTRNLRSVSIRPRIAYATIVGGEVSLPATGTQDILAGFPSVAAGRYIADSYGWVESLSVRLSAARTTGTISFQVYAGGAIGPAVVIDADPDQQDSAYAVYDATTNVFWPTYSIWFRATVTSGTFAPTSADVLLYARLALIVSDASLAYY